MHLCGEKGAAANRRVRDYDVLRRDILIETQYGYGLQDMDDVAGTFYGLGFFVASETSGSTEFVVLNRYFDERWPQLKSIMKAVNNEKSKALYGWVADHQDLEANHARFAFSSVKLAVRHLRAYNPARGEAVKEVKNGVSEFFAMAERLLLGLPAHRNQ